MLGELVRDGVPLCQYNEQSDPRGIRGPYLQEVMFSSGSMLAGEMRPIVSALWKYSGRGPVGSFY